MDSEILPALQPTGMTESFCGMHLHHTDSIPRASAPPPPPRLTEVVASSLTAAATQPCGADKSSSTAMRAAVLGAGGYREGEPWGVLLSEHFSAKGCFPQLSITVGRGPECDVVLDDIRVSSLHFSISIEAEVTRADHPKGGVNNNATSISSSPSSPASPVPQVRVLVTDHSTNGTFVNDMRVGKDRRTELRNGDDITIVRLPEKHARERDERGHGGGGGSGEDDEGDRTMKQIPSDGRACDMTSAFFGNMPATRLYLEKFCFHFYPGSDKLPENVLSSPSPASLKGGKSASAQHASSRAALMGASDVPPPLVKLPHNNNNNNDSNNNNRDMIKPETVAAVPSPSPRRNSQPSVVNSNDLGFFLPVGGPSPQSQSARRGSGVAVMDTSHSNKKRASMSPEGALVPTPASSLTQHSSGMPRDASSVSDVSSGVLTVMPSRNLQWGHRVGAGASGDVYMGIDVASGMIIAIKVLKGTAGGPVAAENDDRGDLSDEEEKKDADHRCGDGHNSCRRRKRRKIDTTSNRDDTILSVVSDISSTGNPTTADNDVANEEEATKAKVTEPSELADACTTKMYENEDQTQTSSSPCTSSSGGGSGCVTTQPNTMSASIPEPSSSSAARPTKHKINSNNNNNKFVIGRGSERRQIQIPTGVRPSHLRELWLLTQLKNHRIVRCLGFQSDPRRGLCILMEYVAGGTLNALIKSFGAFQENVIRLYTVQILEGLEYLCSCRVIHGDLKSANVLVSERGNVKLTDFGTSRIQREYAGARCGVCGYLKKYRYESSTRSSTATVPTPPRAAAPGVADATVEENPQKNTMKSSHDRDTVFDAEAQCTCADDAIDADNNNAFLCGTPLFMSPELIRTQQSTEASDVWALGCIVYEMATGGILPWREVHQSDPLAIVYYIGSQYDHGPSFDDVYAARASTPSSVNHTRSSPAKLDDEDEECRGSVASGAPEALSETFMDFLKSMFTMQPQHRPTASDLLRHPFIAGEVHADAIPEWHRSIGAAAGSIKYGSHGGSSHKPKYTRLITPSQQQEIVTAAPLSRSRLHGEEKLPDELNNNNNNNSNNNSNSPPPLSGILWTTQEWADLRAVGSSALRPVQATTPDTSPVALAPIRGGPSSAAAVAAGEDAAGAVHPSPLLLGASSSDIASQPHNHNHRDVSHGKASLADSEERHLIVPPPYNAVEEKHSNAPLHTGPADGILPAGGASCSPEQHLTNTPAESQPLMVQPTQMRQPHPHHGGSKNSNMKHSLTSPLVRRGGGGEPFRDNSQYYHTSQADNNNSNNRHRGRKSMMRNHQEYLRSQELTRRFPNSARAPALSLPDSSTSNAARRQQYNNNNRGGHSNYYYGPDRNNNNRAASERVALSMPNNALVASNLPPPSYEQYANAYSGGSQQGYSYGSHANTQTMMVSVPRQHSWQQSQNQSQQQRQQQQQRSRARVSPGSLQPGGGGGNNNNNHRSSPVTPYMSHHHGNNNNNSADPPRLSPRLPYRKNKNYGGGNNSIFPDAPPVLSLQQPQPQPPSPLAVAGPPPHIGWSRTSPLIAPNIRTPPLALSPGSLEATGVGANIVNNNNNNNSGIGGGMTLEFSQMGLLRRPSPAQVNAPSSDSVGVLGAVESPFHRKAPPPPSATAALGTTTTTTATTSDGTVVRAMPLSVVTAQPQLQQQPPPPPPPGCEASPLLRPAADGTPKVPAGYATEMSCDNNNNNNNNSNHVNINSNNVAGGRRTRKAQQRATNATKAPREKRKGKPK